MKLSYPVLSSIVSAYGYRLHTIEDVASGYRNTCYMVVTTDDKHLNFILYKKEPQSQQLVRRVNQVGYHLQLHGLPVRSPVDDRILALTTHNSRRFGALYATLPGKTIAWEMYTMKHIKLLGHAMALIHDVDIPPIKLPSIEVQCVLLIDEMKRYFSLPGVQAAMRQKLSLYLDVVVFDELKSIIKQVRGKQSLLHMDLVRGNVLFDTAGGQHVLQIGTTALSGILDLEKASSGPVEFDIARTLGFLYVDCNKPIEKIIKYFIFSGYVKRGNRVVPQIDMIDHLVGMYLIYDLYKFLRDNPYESLVDNHHFRRTRDILMRRQMIQ
ncbi:MAG: phosphotransferase [Candidatus Saccharimonadales bacterium]